MSDDRTDTLATDDAADPTDPGGLTRRRLIQGAASVGVIGVAGTVLAACGGDEPADTTPTGSSGAPSSPEATAGTDALATTADVPVGGGLILEAEKIVITQPTAGDFKAFTAVCTHMGCTVGSVTDNVIECPCHGSLYDASTGANVGPPAANPLAPIEITVTGDQITRA